MLQQPGPASSVVLVASRPRCSRCRSTAATSSSTAPAGSGSPAAPVRVGACAHGAWASGRGSYLQLCDGADAEVERPRGHDQRGRADVPGEPAGRGAQRHAARAAVDAAAGHRAARAELERSSPRRSPRRPRRSPRRPRRPRTSSRSAPTESAPPTAADDAFGVRPGRTTILPVIDNDSSSDCGILAISEFDPLPAEFGRVVAIYGGRALQVAVADGRHAAPSSSRTRSPTGGGRTPRRPRASR